MSNNLRRKEHDNEMDLELFNISKKLLDSDKKLGKLDRSRDADILDIMDEQITLLSNSININFFRLYRTIERYKQVDSKLEVRKNDANQKYKEFEQDLKIKIKEEKNLVDKSLLDDLKKEKKDMQIQHKDYMKKISRLQSSISNLSDRIENISKRTAYRSKDLSNSR